MEQKNHTGDIRLDPTSFLTGEQPIGTEGVSLVRRGYELFEFFRQKLQPEHAEMREARAARRLRQENRSITSPTSMALNSCIDNVIADQIDNTPEAVLVPERVETMDTADEMTDLIGFVMHKADWPGVYQRVMEDVAVTGSGIVEVYWDNDAMGGEGMASVDVWHPEDFYPDPMYENIQDGRACFKATRTTVAWVNEHYPDAAGYVHPDKIRSDEEVNILAEPPSDDAEVTLIEMWYKRYDAKKRKTRVHMAQMAGGAMLYSTELGIGCDKDEYAQGVYAHGEYPFHMFRYRHVWRKPFGTGLYHDFAPTQEAIDRYAKYMDDNARESSVQRHFIRRGSGVNTEDIVDYNKTVIEWDGSDIREVLQTVQAAPINGQVYQMMNHLMETMKQDSGQNPFTRGETAGGVTADSAIQRILTQGSKITRWHAETFKSVFRGLANQMLWLLSEYLDPERKILITGGWSGGGGMKGRVVGLMPAAKEGDELLPPAYSVRVDVQHVNPSYAESYNDRLMKAAETAAQGGIPIPPASLFKAMQGIRDKDNIVRILEEAQEKSDMTAQLQAQVQQLQAELAKNEKLVRGWRKEFFGSQGGANAVNRQAARNAGAPQEQETPPGPMPVTA